jgi:hypothetical protein
VILMTSETRLDTKRQAFVVSLSGYASGDNKDHEKIKQYLKNSDDKSSPEKLAFSSKNKFTVVDIYVEICDGPQKITIPKQYLEYSASNEIEITKQGDMTGAIEETIQIYTSPDVHNKDTFWAGLNLSIKFKENLKKEMTFPVEVGIFTGTGTGALIRASMDGIDNILNDFECAESITGWGVNYARIGFVRGWPPEVISWPPP